MLKWISKYVWIAAVTINQEVLPPVISLCERIADR